MTPATQDENAKQPRRRWPGWLWLLLAILLAGSLYLLQVTGTVGDLGVERWLAHRDDFLALIQEYPLTAMLAVFAVHTLLAALALPGASLLMLAAGSGFGTLGGTIAFYPYADPEHLQVEGQDRDGGRTTPAGQDNAIRGGPADQVHTGGAHI